MDGNVFLRKVLVHHGSNACYTENRLWLWMWLWLGWFHESDLFICLFFMDDAMYVCVYGGVYRYSYVHMLITVLL